MSVKHLRFFGPWALFLAFLFWASSQPGSDVPSAVPDYVLHAGAYFVLGLLTIRAFAQGLVVPPAEEVHVPVLVGAFLFSVLFGISDEWHQSFVPGRDPAARDVGWDALGAFVAAVTVGVFWRWRYWRTLTVVEQVSTQRSSS